MLYIQDTYDYIVFDKIKDSNNDIKYPFDIIRTVRNLKTEIESMKIHYIKGENVRQDILKLINPILEKYDIFSHTGYIRTDCYLAKLNEFKKLYPDALFKVITHRTHSPLAPSTRLLIEAGIFEKSDGSKNPKMDFDEYRKRFIEEIKNSKSAMIIIHDLNQLWKNGNVIFLVCYEKDPAFCHRSIIKKLIEEYKEDVRK